MASEMVERVARAINVCIRDMADDGQIAGFEDMARAAIKAMREPTEEMCWEFSHAEFGEVYGQAPGYRAMIDAALTTPEPPHER